MLIVALRKGPLYTMCAILHFYLNIHVHANALYKCDFIYRYVLTCGCTLLCIMYIYIAWQAIAVITTCIYNTACISIVIAPKLMRNCITGTSRLIHKQYNLILLSLLPWLCFSMYKCHSQSDIIHVHVYNQCISWLKCLVSCTC